MTIFVLIPIQKLLPHLPSPLVNHFKITESYSLYSFTGCNAHEKNLS